LNFNDTLYHWDKFSLNPNVRVETVFKVLKMCGPCAKLALSTGGGVVIVNQIALDLTGTNHLESVGKYYGTHRESYNIPEIKKEELPNKIGVEVSSELKRSSIFRQKGYEAFLKDIGCPTIPKDNKSN
jgi:hypothetical protein